ncbi:MAG TPA: hypothetical protein VN729_01340 [Ktedonobacteraceae bacterium]|nr:hypothetical protein [Ktedonobacteraceae bacterium]
MPTIGVDAEVIIDGSGYFVRPRSYTMQQPRIRKVTVRADGGQAYVDLGPGRRIWKLIILCVNDQLKYDGTPTNISGQQYRDALRASYTSSVGSTIQFIDPLNGAPIAVHFDSYSELVYDLRVQQVALATGAPPALSYEVEIVLIEA